jgi:hypothetical protein
MTWTGIDTFIWELLLEFIKRFVESRDLGSGERQLGTPTPLNHDYVDRESCTLFPIEIAPDGEVISDVVMLVEQVIEGSALA